MPESSESKPKKTQTNSEINDSIPTKPKSTGKLKTPKLLHDISLIPSGGGIGIVFLVILLALSVGLMYNGILYVNGTYELYPDYTYEIQFNGIDHYNKTRGFYSEITMTSKAFAAHSPIHVAAKVLVFTNQTLSNGTIVAQTIDPNDMQTVYVVFPRSHLENAPITEFPNPKPGGAIEAIYGRDGKSYWYGEADLKYEMQGSYVLGITSRAVEVIEEQDDVRSASFINIASEEVMSQRYSNRLTIGLAWAIMGLAVITAIPVLNAIMVYAQEYEETKKSKSHPDTTQHSTSDSQ
jgi:hypothetical protein